MANVYPFDRGQNITVITDGDADAAHYDQETQTVQVPLPDGMVQISFGPPQTEHTSKDFKDNLADYLDEMELTPLAERLLEGIAQDEQTRSEWMANMAAGISLLALQIKSPQGAAASLNAPQEGMSNIDHPLLLEAVLRFQANAYGEMLPADGPVKVRNDGEGNELAVMLSTALEKDLNHYLTKVATEYYPDTDRMLLMLGFSGISFKKGYHDPIKRRPVIKSIDAKDLIVSNAATDLEGAGRVTHRITMKPSTFKRMQLLGVYRNVHVQPPSSLQPQQNPVDAKIGEIQGIAPPTYMQEEDRDRELYECYCEIEVPGFEHKIDGEATGLPLPYRVTLDVESRRILEIRRNWDEDDPFCLPINRIIAYTFIPGLGFYGIGLLNVLGNATKAVTAAWRLMIDAGMFANFPGFLYLKSLSKQLTNQFRVAPGTGMAVDAVGNDIRASIMPLPYKDPSTVFIQLIENIATTAQRVGGIGELQIGEGKQNAPVGTVLALIEQATKLMGAVHKRCHQSQGAEFDMLKSLLAEDPEALWRHNKKSKVLALLRAQTGGDAIADAQEAAEDRQSEIFVAALADCTLVPASDPNTSSQTERYLKSSALRQMADSNQSIDKNKVDKRIMKVMGIDDADSLFMPPPPASAMPSPDQVTAQATQMAAQARLIDAATKAREAQIKAATAAVTTQTTQQEMQDKKDLAHLALARELVIHQGDQQLAREKLAHEGQQNALDRAHEQQQNFFDRRLEHQQGVAERMHDQRLDSLDHMHKLALASLGHRAKAAQGVADHAHDGLMAYLDRAHQANENAAQRAADSANQPEGVAS